MPKSNRDQPKKISPKRIISPSSLFLLQKTEEMRVYQAVVVVVWAKPQVEPWRWWPTKKVAEGLAVDDINLGSGFCWKTLWFSEN
jgi:hypothetical protein